MEGTFLERAYVDWIAAGSAFVLAGLVVPVVRAILRRRFKEDDQGGRSWRALVARLNARWLKITTFVLALGVAVLVLQPPPRVMAFTRIALVVMLAIQALILIPTVIDWCVERVVGRHGTDEERAAMRTTLAGLRWAMMLGVYATVVLIALQNLGVDVTAMVAGLGISGIAIALAVQNILGDLFASLTISMDKPFVVGDFIVVGNEKGTVETIGLKTTRVRSVSGEQMVFSNSDLLASRIRNFKRMSERRVEVKFGVTYATPPEKLAGIPAIVKRAVEGFGGGGESEGVAAGALKFDHCHMMRMGDSALEYELVYIVPTPDAGVHMDSQQAIMLTMVREFAAAGIDFAFPTRTVIMEGRERV